jgi:hypothetical protein
MIWQKSKSTEKVALAAELVGGHVLKFTSKMLRMRKVKLWANFELRKTSLKEVWKGLWSNAPNKEQMAVPYR